jgi:hypothetical protein
MFGMYPRHNPADYGMPAHTSRRWVIENSDLSGRIMMKTPDWAEVPIPADRRGAHFTHALYVVLCDHDDFCNCSDDDSVEWEFVEFFNITEIPPPPLS